MNTRKSLHKIPVLVFGPELAFTVTPMAAFAQAAPLSEVIAVKHVAAPSGANVAREVISPGKPGNTAVRAAN